jgi:hypothetical protein
MLRGVVKRVRRWFVKLHGGQVAMLWLAWGALWWGVRLLAVALALAGTPPIVSVALFFVVDFVLAPLMIVLSWLWFDARREA